MESDSFDGHRVRWMSMERIGKDLLDRFEKFGGGCTEYVGTSENGGRASGRKEGIAICRPTDEGGQSECEGRAVCVSPPGSPRKEPRLSEVEVEVDAAARRDATTSERQLHV